MHPNLIAGDNGEAAVIDPRRDVEEYIADAKAAGLRSSTYRDPSPRRLRSGHVEAGTADRRHNPHRERAVRPIPQPSRA